MVHTIVELCAGNGVGKVVVGRGGLLSTPAVSALIRSLKAEGGFILTASHNPGGPDADCGLKYNVSSGGPAPESLTEQIYAETLKISSFRRAELPARVDLQALGCTRFGPAFEVEVVDSTDNYVALMKSVFDFGALQQLVARPDFSMCFDAMHGVAGPYAVRIFCSELGVPRASLLNCEPSPDFGGGHPDPNLTYAEELVRKMGLDAKGAAQAGAVAFDFGAAADGDADRNMVLGRKFFVTPSDSLAVIAANADAIPFFKRAGGLRSVARSMPTSGAVDLVASKLGLALFQVPTGWKFFGNLMDSALLGKEERCPLLCGEESFGTGSNHIREKDGLWAVLAWLSILAARNSAAPHAPLVTVEKIVLDHWQHFGRSYYCRYDYENVESDKAALVMARLNGAIALHKRAGPVKYTAQLTLTQSDEFTYHDPVDGSVSRNQGWRFIFADGSRFVLRLSGTGSVGATIRLYMERYSTNAAMLTADALKDILDVALELSDLPKITGRAEPTVIT
jgi:phosphoglucomutase